MTANKHGPAFAAWLRGEIDARGESPTGWLRHNGIAATALRTWEDGADPQMDLLQRVAEALGPPRRLVDMLIAADYIAPSDVGVTLVPTSPPKIDAAIDRDPDLSGMERDLLRAARRMAQSVRHGIMPPDETITTA